ncbi:MAG: hypothetical protein GXY07_07340 [Candidatus Hydrogenedentes bacterium]|nr:hypothetical protein [Candidatus Hydrogenedentota bacterium]
MYLHEAHLANIVTSYCTCLGGLIPLVYCAYTRNQPRRWVWVYFCVFLTGLPTVWLHTVEGSRVASFFDVGTNILLAWMLIVAVSGDYMAAPARRKLIGITFFLNVLAWCWLLYEVFAPEKKPLLTLWDSGHFYTGEVALILNAWIGAALFIIYRRRINPAARPFLYTILGIFIFGIVLATGDNNHITGYILPWHAAWHIIGAFGFITLWAFNHVRFSEGLLPVTPEEPATECVRGIPIPEESRA